MNKSNPIIGITLEGFQVFDKPTYIPLDRLTLLFGPNSAGKSAVQDAIELYCKLIASGISRPYPALDLDIQNILKRHWRRTGKDDDSRVKKLSVCVTCSNHFDEVSISSIIAAIHGRKLLNTVGNEIEKDIKIESRWHFIRGEDNNNYLSFNWDFEFFIDSKIILSYIDNEFSLNLWHPIINCIEKNVDFEEVAKNHPEEIAFIDGIFTFKESVGGFNPVGLESEEKAERWLYWHHMFVDGRIKKRKSLNTPLLDAALGEIALLTGTLLSQTLATSGQLPIKVDASRSVPTRDDLTFEFEEVDGSRDDMYRPLSNGNSTYTLLAGSLASSLWKTPSYTPPDEDKNYARNINRALSDHLFLEQGYRIDYDYRVLLSKANSYAACTGEDLNPSEFGYLVELFLRDSHDRKHLFEDVGSGIGYLLPVLCAVFNSSNMNRSYVCSIQQPELHIHPALQSALGDVFIDASMHCQQLLIETHSEHLLLRILKRIRQTHLQVAIAPELKINADDVCVLYFDPSPDGTTTVKRLRITEDGEFMDRWPRGFFGERDQELLDE